MTSLAERTSQGTRVDGAGDVRGPVSRHRRPGVLFAGNFYSAEGGSLSVCEDLSGRLAAIGWPVITVSRHRPRLRKLADMVSTAWRRRDDYAVAQIDVFSDAAFTWAEGVAYTARLAGKSYVLTLHGGNLPMFAARFPGRVRRLLSGAAAVTAPSEFLRAGMREYRDDIVVVPNALALEQYPYRERSELSANLVWVRAFHAVYNPSLLPRAVALIAGRISAISVVMAGPDKGDGALERTMDTARSLGVAHLFRFPGGVPKADVPSVIASGDIFVNTSDIDNTPVSVTEAMACGVPIVTTAVGGIPDLLHDDREALLVPRDDAPALAAAIERLLHEPGLGTRLARAARTRAVAFGWDAVLPTWEALLLDAVSRSRVRHG